MDIQLKKGLLDWCVLKSLEYKESYGYQIIKDISSYVEISESTLYPILKKLENNKMLESYTKEYNTRLRKYYKITSLGKDKIKDFINQWEKINIIYNFIKGDDKDE